MKRVLFFGWLLLGAVLFLRAELPEVPFEVVEELGVTLGKPQRDGYVFINGRYLGPPYTVTRRGNGIFINRVLAEKPLPWPPVDYIEAPEETPKLNVMPAGDDEGIGTLDDLLLDDEPVVRPQPAPTALTPGPRLTTTMSTSKKAPGLNVDSFFLDDDAYTPPVIRRPAAVPPPPPPPKPKFIAVPSNKSEAELAEEREHLIEQLDALRLAYERSLARGDFFFFSDTHARVTGTSGSARILIGVLPSALRYATTPQDLFNRLTQEGLTFLDQNICTELFKNKNTFPLLEQRLKRIQEGETIERMKRENAARPW